jgi:hypothetical protein
LGISELAEIGLAAVETDADADIRVGQADAAQDLVVLLAKAILNLARGQQRLRRVIRLFDGEIEDSQNGVAECLVQDAVIAPDRSGAFVVERIEQ